jgi:hypothetical protein
MTSSATSPRVFISYHHGEPTSPPRRLVQDLSRSLSATHRVFSDADIPAGERWGERIQNEIAGADVFVALMSTDAMWSEMVIDEVARAHQLYKATGRPRIVPVRVDNDQPFPYPLSAYLGTIQWFRWQGDADTSGLLHVLGGTAAVVPSEFTAGANTDEPRGDVPPAPLAPLESPTGSVHPDSAFYLRRYTDGIAENTLRQRRLTQSTGAPIGITLNIKGSRQMGKTSLLTRLKPLARSLDRAVVFIDFQLFDEATLRSPEAFYPSFVFLISDGLDLVDTFERHRHPRRTLPLTCTRYMQLDVLPTFGKPITVVMDEVDKVFAAPFRDDFFGMLRSWHDARSDTPFANVDIVLAASTEPSHFISPESTQSPFNVGESITLSDFTPSEVHVLNERHAWICPPAEEGELFELLQGHPFLTRRALYLLASRRLDFEALRQTATRDDGPFGDHLRYYLTKIHEVAHLLEAFREVLANGWCKDPRLFDMLKGFGLVGGDGSKARARNPLYASYFSRRIGRVL